MSSIEDEIKLLRKIAREEIGKNNGGVRNTVMHGTWVAPESVDPNLSQVRLAGEEGGILCRGVRKLGHVTGLQPGQQIMMMRSGTTPLTIIGIVVGDITKIEV